MLITTDSVTATERTVETCIGDAQRYRYCVVTVLTNDECTSMLETEETHNHPVVQGNAKLQVISTNTHWTTET